LRKLTSKFKTQSFYVGLIEIYNYYA